MKSSHDNRFQDFFVDEKYIILKNYLYNYLLRKYSVDKELRYEKRDLVLEVGSGISPIVTTNSHVVYSELSILALQKLKHYLGKGMYVAADGMKLPFRSESFSHVICSEVLEHLEDDRKALEEIARVMKPEGILLITFPHRRFYFTYDDHFVQHYRRYELEEMENRLKDVGLSPVIVRKVLGPLEKITMCIAVFIFSIVQRFHRSDERQMQSSKKLIVLSPIFKWINVLFAGLVWFDAMVMPRALSTVLLIKAVKKEQRKERSFP